MTPKEYYRNYLADDYASTLTTKIILLIKAEQPSHVLEFGCGTGKNINFLDADGIPTIGIDISFMNCITAKVKYNLPCLICADETYLRNIVNCDCVFTVSVLDHIDDIDGIIGEFKRIANKAILLAETNDVPGEFYYPHDYESYDFEKLDFEWMGEDGAKYEIWKWQKEERPIIISEISMINSNE